MRRTSHARKISRAMKRSWEPGGASRKAYEKRKRKQRRAQRAA